MHNTKERLSLFWIFALSNYLYADVVALFAIVGSGHSFKPLPPLALLGSAVLMEIPARHDPGVPAASVSSEPAGECHRGQHNDPCEWSPDIRCASDYWSLAACVSRVLILRDDRNGVHPGHHLAGVDLVRG
jgi:hypothetical protein